MDVMQKVIWMDTNRTMKDVWLEHTNGSFGVLGSGSDYTAFVHRGIGSVSAPLLYGLDCRIATKGY